MWLKRSNKDRCEVSVRKNFSSRSQGAPSIHVSVRKEDRSEESINNAVYPGGAIQLPGLLGRAVCHLRGLRHAEARRVVQILGAVVSKILLYVQAQEQEGLVALQLQRKSQTQ